MKIQRETFASREEALEAGVVWTYGYALNREFLKHFKAQVPANFQQYDVEMFFFMNYVPNPKIGHNGFPTDISRAEHWWRAAERRWPSVQDEDGRLMGDFERDPWSEQFIDLISKYNTVNVLGGAGQGKTTTFIAFGLTVFDYFAHTHGGARFQFSSVSEEKVKGAAWEIARKLYSHSNTECSPNISNAVAFPGKMEIRRKGNLSGQGMVRGVLIRNDSTAADKIEKLTGMHEPEAQLILTDETQDSPKALSMAAKNLRTHAKWFWQFRTGNPKRPDDYLGQAAKPIDGWDSVNPAKVENPPLIWETNYEGDPGVAMRLSNENSPGVLDPIKYHYRPTLASRDENFPTVQSRQMAQYQRMWLGWFVPEGVNDTLLKKDITEQMACHQFCNINRRSEIINFMSFDPAPESIDRNPLGRFQICYEGDKRVLNISQIFLMPPMNPATYERESKNIILEKAQEWQVTSGNLIMDYTVHCGTKAMLQEEGFNVVCMRYSDLPSDKPIERHAPRSAKDIYANVITEAAFIFEALIRNGQVRGLNEHVIPGIDEEMYLRKVVEHAQGGKLKLEAKAGAQGFRKRNNFSPDIFDICCQAAWLAREKFGLIPGIDKPLKTNNIPKSEKILSGGGWQRRYL